MAAKYVRKFVYSKLIALGVPESVADFIQGRSARTVGARSYLAKLELAKAHYGRYARYLAELRAKAGLTAEKQPELSLGGSTSTVWHKLPESTSAAEEKCYPDQNS